MTRFYSSTYTDDGINRTSISIENRLSLSASDGGRVAYRRALMDLSTVTVLVDDVLRFFRVRSGDRPIALFLSGDGGFTLNAGLDIGYWQAGIDHNGLVLDSTAHAPNASVSIDLALARSEVFALSSGQIADEDRGLTAWELLNSAGASYTRDPMETWDLTGQVKVAGGSGVLLMEMYYLPVSG